MKKVFLFFIFILFFQSGKLSAQAVDSISIRLTQSSPDSVVWTYFTQYIDSFSLGKLKTYLERQYLNNIWENEWMWNFNYSATVDTEIHYKWNGQWDNYYKRIYFHNAQGLDTAIYLIVWNNGWIYQNKKICTYNADSSLATRLNIVWNTTTSQWENDTYEYWSKDSLQRDTSQTIDLFTAGVQGPWQRISFTYDSLGNLISAIGNYWDNSDSTYWLTYHTDYWTYDSLHNVIHSASSDVPGGSGHTYYYYFPDYNLSDTWQYYEHSGTGTWYHTRYYYDLQNNVYVFLPDDFSICENDSVQIGGFTFGGLQPVHINWTPATGLSSDTVENPIVNTHSSQTYVFQVTDANNLTATDSIHINVYPAPILDSIISIPASCSNCPDGTFYIYPSTGISNYSVFPDSGALFGTNMIYGLIPGVYTICMESLDGCNSCFVDSISFNIGIKENYPHSVFITKNPFSDFTDIHCNIQNENLKLQIFDGTGRSILQKKITTPVTRIYRDNLKNGIYFGVLFSDDKIFDRMKLIIVEN